jgi:hypothetical protein
VSKRYNADQMVRVQMERGQVNKRDMIQERRWVLAGTDGIWWDPGIGEKRLRRLWL